MKRSSFRVVSVVLLALIAPSLLIAGDDDCKYKEKEEGISCSTGDCVCGAKGLTVCAGQGPSYLRGDSGNGRTRCKGSGDEFKWIIITGTPAPCGNTEENTAGCILLLNEQGEAVGCACPTENTTLYVPSMVGGQPIGRPSSDCQGC